MPPSLRVLLLLLLFLVPMAESFSQPSPPAPKRAVAAATWHFGRLAVEEAATVLSSSSSSSLPPSLALDAVEAGVNRVETDNQEQYYVGYGGFPNAEGEMELDAAIMCGTKRTYGAVCALQVREGGRERSERGKKCIQKRDVCIARWCVFFTIFTHLPSYPPSLPPFLPPQGTIKAISVARRVMENCVHSVLVGKGANTFAKQQGFEWEEVLSPEARERWRKWKEEEEKRRLQEEGQVETAAAAAAAAAATAPPPPPTDDALKDVAQHDTIGLLVMDAQGNLAAGTSTSGWRFKHPGTSMFPPSLPPSFLFVTEGGKETMRVYSHTLPISLPPSLRPRRRLSLGG